MCADVASIINSVTVHAAAMQAGFGIEGAEPIARNRSHARSQ